MDKVEKTLGDMNEDFIRDLAVDLDALTDRLIRFNDLMTSDAISECTAHNELTYYKISLGLV